MPIFELIKSLRKVGEMKFHRRVFYGIEDRKVVDVMKSIPRELFVSDDLKDYAYMDRALPIGCDQTISQPSLVAYMTQLLQLSGRERVLEIGTGSGYQTAILANLADRVYTVEIIEELYKEAREKLKLLGIKNVVYRLGSGYEGWVKYAPYDRIMVTAAPPKIPMELLEQLDDNGRMLIPVGKADKIQHKTYRKKGDSFIEEDLQYVRFVPMVED